MQPQQQQFAPTSSSLRGFSLVAEPVPYKHRPLLAAAACSTNAHAAAAAGRPSFGLPLSPLDTQPTRMQPAHLACN